jgi:hypothetical protein
MDNEIRLDDAAFPGISGISGTGISGTDELTPIGLRTTDRRGTTESRMLLIGQNSGILGTGET